MRLRFFKKWFSPPKRNAAPETGKSAAGDRRMNFVLSYSAGSEQTSLVSCEEIRRAIDHLDEYGDLWLSYCRDVSTPYGHCTGISCTHGPDGNTQVAVYFAAPNGLTRYACHHYRRRDIAGMFCNYFERLEIPDIAGWNKDDLTRAAPTPGPCVLYVDNYKYEHITYPDVTAALDELKAGLCQSVLLHTPSNDDGYMEVRGTPGDFIVEIGGHNSRNLRVVYTTRTPYGGHVAYWLNNYFHKREFPRITEEWTNITEKNTAGT